jgi:hypothetical protein
MTRSQVTFAISSGCDRIPFAVEVVENGLLWRPPEKKAATLDFSIQESTFSGPVLWQ